MQRDLMPQQEHQQGVSSKWELEGLAAFEPHPELREKLELFGQFVGDWDILECRYLEDDGTWSKSRGELHWRWILEGKALQDIWSSVDEETHRVIPGGTTVRFYDPKIDAWRSTWISPDQGVVKPFIGHKVGNEIILERKDEEKGHLDRWIFSDITESTFRWRGEKSEDGGKTWKMYEEMKIRRKT